MSSRIPEELRASITATAMQGSESADTNEGEVPFAELLERSRCATQDDLPGILEDLRYLADSKTPHADREAIFKALKEATGVTVKALKTDYAQLLPEREQAERATISEQLLTLILPKVELWHDLDGEPYITLKGEKHQEHHRLNTRAVKRWIQREWHEASEGAIGREPLSEALGVLEGKAVHDGQQHETFIRVAELGEGDQAEVYIDMGDEAWHAIRITAQGWSIITSEATPVRFIRSAGMLALPTPQPGSLDDVAAALGLPSTAADGSPFRPFQGAVAWLLQAFRPAGPFPVLPLFGQQGSGKTTFTKRLCGLLDPHTATLRVLSRDERDILISARNSWLQAKDNVSHLNQWTSDAFCRLATGGAISTRTLYTNDEETILNAKRPVLLNGITNFLEQQDLVDRAIPVSLPAIPEGERLPERELEAQYDRLKPKALGALLDVVAAGLARSGHRYLARLPRMADFAEWIVACAPALGWGAEDFLNWYAGTRADLVREALDASAITPALLALMADQDQLLLSSSELLAALAERQGISDGKRAPAGWPKRPQNLTNELNRLAPALLQAEGIELEQTRDKSKRGWSLRNIGKSSSPSSPAPWLLQEPRPARLERDDDEEETHRHPSSPIVTDDDTMTMLNGSSSPRTSRAQRHHDEGDDDDDEIPTLPEDASFLSRVGTLTAHFAALPIEKLREKYQLAAERAQSTPSFWPDTAKTENLAVTVALELLSKDQTLGTARAPQHYLNAARQAVANLSIPEPSSSQRIPPAGIPL